MRQIYTSPRLENIDRVVALLGDHGIQTRVLNRSVYKRPSYDRFRYTARNDRDSWPIVEIVHAEDLTPARNIMRDIGIEPPVRHSEILEAMRQRDAGASGGTARRDHAVRRARTIVLVVLGVALVVMAIKAFQVF